MSSANLPRPRRRRFSSLRGSDLPTQFFLSASELNSYSRADFARLDGRGRLSPHCQLSSMPSANHLSTSERSSCPVAPAGRRRPTPARRRPELHPAILLWFQCPPARG